VASLGVHHVGVAVDDLDAAVATYKELFGAAVEHRELIEEQGVEAAWLRVGAARIELLAPLAADTPVGRFLAKRSPGLHHVALEVEDLPAELDRLRQAGVQLIDEAPRCGMFGLQVAFVHPQATGGVLAEFVQRGRG